MKMLTINFSLFVLFFCFVFVFKNYKNRIVFRYVNYIIMSISITNSLPISTANASLSIDSTKNVEPLAVRGEF